MSKTDSQKACFVIYPMGEEGSPTRERSDKVFRHVIHPSVMTCGYAEPVQAGAMPQPGIITSQVVQHVIQDDLVIADLTGSNPNVFYELAIRHAVQKPVIHLMVREDDEDEIRAPFDIQAMRYTAFRLTDLDDVERAKAEVQESIRSIEGGASIQTPISIAVDLLSIVSQSPPGEGAGLNDILELLAAMNERLNTMSSHLSSPKNILPRQYLEGLLKEFDARAASNLSDPGEKIFMLRERHCDLERRLSEYRHEIERLSGREHPISPALRDAFLDIRKQVFEQYERLREMNILTHPPEPDADILALLS